MKALDHAIRRANELRFYAYAAEADGDFIRASKLHEAANKALRIGDRAARLKTLLEALAALATGSPRALRRWSLALWVLGARVKTLRAIRRRSAAQLGGLAS